MLISVVVVTYNSSKYVLQTLESVCRQTYRDIELIVSDDCSIDETFGICSQWVDEHLDRFVGAQVTQTTTNSGISHNYNHALRLAKGDYIKYIAGDDILETNCIERYVSNLSEGTFLYTCTLGHYHNETSAIEYYKTRLPEGEAAIQARFMLRYLYGINGPTLFVNRKKLIELNGFDEKYPLVEDWPIAMKFLVNGYKIGIIPEKLVLWRIYEDSISHSNYGFSESLRNAIYDYTSRYCLDYFLPLHKYHYWLENWIYKNRNTGLKKYLGYVLRCVDLVNTKRKIIPIDNNQYEKIISDNV